MRPTFFFALLSVTVAAADLIVHEWGTFTAVSGSNGLLLSGLEREEERLPNFVYSHAGFAPANKGWERPVAGVTVKMETPVLYFYSAESVALRIDVRFRGGSISQWYPDRMGGEQVAAMPRDLAQRQAAPAIDFARGYLGAATWQVDILPRNSSLAVTAPRSWETPQWSRARVAAANLLRGPKGEIEGFIFYRGLGRFALPLAERASDDGRLAVRNDGADPIANGWLYERREEDDDTRRFARLALQPGEERSEPTPRSAADSIQVSMHAGLVAAGLTMAEASALLATWHESYFARPGLRIFWIVPRRFTEAVLPMTITPRPAKLERVLVGRLEILTPQFEARLRRDFARDGGIQWAGDRYFRAYQERVRQLGGAVDVAPVQSAQ